MTLMRISYGVSDVRCETSMKISVPWYSRRNVASRAVTAE